MSRHQPRGLAHFGNCFGTFGRLRDSFTSRSSATAGPRRTGPLQKPCLAICSFTSCPPASIAIHSEFAPRWVWA